MKNEKGITLIALVITIIILLLLLTITIRILVGNNGIINRAGVASEEYEISSEKEQVNMAQMSLKDETNVKEESWEKIIRNTKATKVSDTEYIIKFNKSGRLYWAELDDDVIYIGKDKENEFEEIDEDGSEGKPYVINTIEDLVEFSNNVRNGTSYNGKYIVLNRNLDFKMTDSYKNYKTTEYGDINQNGSIEPLIIEMNKDEGFKPIGNGNKIDGAGGGGSFEGTFDGNGYTLNNIYENRTENASLFSYAKKAVIKNININGTLISNNGIAAGILAYGEGGTKVENCINEAMISGVNAGGIVGRTADNQTIQNCINKGNVIAEEDAGGILGFSCYSNNKATINYCANLGSVVAQKKYAGGIIGECSLYSGGNEFCINYSYNRGTIESKENYAAGLIGRYSDGSLTSCYNVGNIITKGNNLKGPMLGNTFATKVECSNCYYIKGDYGVSINRGIEEEESNMKTQNFVDLLNQNLEKKIWRLDSTNENNGYPIF